MKLPNALSVTMHDDQEEMGIAVARRVAQVAAQAIAERGDFRIALAGGETPRRCYELLRSMPVDWKLVQVYFGDERCLPRGDARRNDSMVREALLGHIDIPAGNVHAIPAELGAQAAATEYAAVISHALPLDLVLLGMGEDGHTASLFPGDPATERDDAIVPVLDAPKPPPERVSLGLRTLNAARVKVFMVAGQEKYKALEQVAHGAALPAARVQGAEWHIDKAAWPSDSDR